MRKAWLVLQAREQEGKAMLFRSSHSSLNWQLQGPGGVGISLILPAPISTVA